MKDKLVDARVAKRLAQKRRWWHRHKTNINKRRRKAYQQANDAARRAIENGSEVEGSTEVVPDHRG